MDPNNPGIVNIKVKEIPEKELSANSVRVKIRYAGLNFLDLYAANGEYNRLNSDHVLGFEGVGDILEIGKGVQEFKPGERVVFATNPAGGALAESIVIDKSYLVTVPNSLTDKVVAASFAKGLTAHYLIMRTYIVQKGIPILVQAAASGVGRFICSWARSYGAIVMGTVGSDAKREVAESVGCQLVYNYTDANWDKELLKKTENYGVACVYDGVGQATFEKSLNVLGKMGLLALYGFASGPVANIPIKKLQEKSLFVSTPSLFDYKDNHTELILSAAQLFEAIEMGAVLPLIYKETTLEDVPSVMQEMQARKVIGSTIVAF